jgi:TRAP-type C4-dicarboxylate transport system permease small subunit
MKTISRLIERIALAVLMIGGFGMLASTFLGTADVVGTQFFAHPVPGALELTESTMVVIVFGALTYSQIRRNHIRVELLYTRAGARGQAAMDIFADLMGLLFFGLLLWQAISEAQFSIEINEATFGLIRFPLWPARVVLAAGTALLILQLAIDLVTDVQRLIHGGEGLSSEQLLQREIAGVDALIEQRSP